MKKVKIKDLVEGDLVVVNKGTYYYEFEYSFVLDDTLVEVYPIGSSIPKYYTSEEDTVDVAETIEDFRS